MTTNKKNIEIIEACRATIFRYISGLSRDVGEAEEITQDTLFRAYEKISGLNNHKKLIPWLYRIGTNIFLDKYRSKKAAKNATEHTELWSDSGLENFRDENAPQLQTILECKEMSDCVSEYLIQVSDNYRAVIILHDLEGLTCREIANVLDISIYNAKIRLQRARKHLKDILEDVCEFHVDKRGILVCERKNNT